MSVADNLRAVLGSLPAGVGLVAVSKYHGEAAIREAYAAGQRVFGESHERELAAKAASLPADVVWHFIGHLQRNKVRHIVGYIGMVESVDSLRLMEEIDRQAVAAGRVVDILLELHIAREEGKYGFTPSELLGLLASGAWRGMRGIRICGLMMMASNTDDGALVAAEFDRAKACFDEVKARFFADAPWFAVRSWGMSGDYVSAVAHGSNLVRVGTRIFGERVY